MADKILKGKSLFEEEMYPQVEAVEKVYGGILESASPKDGEQFVTRDRLKHTYYPIPMEDVAFVKNNWPNSAPGPDGLDTADIKKVPNEVLAILFSVMLLQKFVPPSWREARTTLLHKEGPRDDPKNWRPITIGSATQRLFHRIIANRLKAAH